MKKLLLFIPLTFFPLPAFAITWGEFWTPFTYNQSPPPVEYYVPMCRRKVYHEEYVPGNGWTRGYVRSWYEFIHVPCNY